MHNTPTYRAIASSAFAMMGAGLVSGGVWISGASAGSQLHLMMNDQDSVALGEVISVQDQQLTFQPTAIVKGKRLPRRLTVTVQVNQDIAGELVPGDFAVFPLQKEQGQYQIDFDGVKVDSLDMTQTKVLDGPLGPQEHFIFNWFINSCGQDTDSFSDGNTGQVGVKRDGQLVPIGEKEGADWKRISEPLQCQPRSNSRWRSFLEFFGL